MKIFRKLRLHLLFQTNIRKYLLYAIGEIILVVIGILIALSINNWKNGIERDKKEVALYKTLIEELQIDLGEIRDSREYNTNYLNLYRFGSDIIKNDNERAQIDTLAFIATEITKFSDFRNEGSAYQKLNVSGKTDLITDNEILKSLQRLGILYTYIDRLEQNQTDFMYSVVPKLTDFLRYNPLEVMKPDGLYGYNFHNDIEIIIMICKEKNDLYNDAEEDLTTLINKLQKKIQ